MSERREKMVRALMAYLKIKPEDLDKKGSSKSAVLNRVMSLVDQTQKPTKKRTGGMDMMKKKGYARGGAKMKKMRAGGGKMPMAKDPKTGKMIPTYAMDGKGKMRAGGTMKKKGMARGGMKKKGYARGGTARRK